MEATVREKISKELFAGERLLWSGGPLPRGVDRTTPLYVLVFLFLIVSTGFTGVMFVRLIINEGLSGGTMVPSVFPIIFFSALLHTVVLEPRARRNTSYALTDGRVLIVGGLFGRKVERLSLGEMSGTNVLLDEHRDRSGTIRFADFARACGEDGDMVCMPTLEKVPDAQQVVSLIRRTLDKRSASW